MSNSSKYNIQAETVQITEQNYGTIIGKQVDQANTLEIQTGTVIGTGDRIPPALSEKRVTTDRGCNDR